MFLPPIYEVPEPLSIASKVQWNSEEGERISRLRRTIATVTDGRAELGSAVLIGADGTFLAHRSVANRIGILGAPAKFGDGTAVRLFVASRDLPTQYVLLRARPWTPGPVPVRIFAGELDPGRTLAAIAGSRVFRAEVSNRERTGVDTRTRRMVPLTELRFESGTPDVGGAALFTLQGDFVGCVAATLPQVAPKGNTAERLNAMRFGPVGLVVGYATSPGVTRRAVEGFLSPAQRPQIATIGVLCRDATGGGALIEAVDRNSPADRAGLRAGDILLQAADQPIGDQIAFAKLLYNLKPEVPISMRIRRAGIVLTLTVTPGISG